MKQLSFLLLFLGIFLTIGCQQNSDQPETKDSTSPNSIEKPVISSPSPTSTVEEPMVTSPGSGKAGEPLPPIRTDPIVLNSGSVGKTSPPTYESDEQKAVGDISGRLIEYFPDTMEVGKMSRIIVEISPDTSEAGFQMEIERHSTLSKHKEEVTTALISGIGKEMRASLKGDKNHFEIEAMAENNLRLLDLQSDEFIRWEWDVRPLSHGDHELSLVIERIEGEASDPVPILTKSVTVLVEKTFIRSYGGLIGGLFAVLLAGGFFYFKKRRKKIKQLVFKHKEEVFTLVGQNKTEKALSLLETTFANEHIHDEITMIKARFNDTKEKGMKGVLDHDTFTRERNKVNNDILELMKSFD